MSELRLSSIEQGLSVDQVIALTEVEKRYELKQAELDLKRKLALPIIWVFLGINAVTIAILIMVGLVEWQAIAGGREIERLVTPEVVMTIIGATTVQLGAIMYAVATGVFGGPADE